MNGYLNPDHHYQSQLIRLGNEGKPFVVACTQEGLEPEYEGFATQDEAANRAAELEAIPSNPGTEDEFTPTFAVYELKQDEDGDWTCSYDDIR